MNSPRMRVAVSALLALSLITTAVVKIVNGFDDVMSLSRLSYYTAIMLEFLLAGLLFTRYWRLAALLTLLFVIFGIGYQHFLVPEGKICGCTGLPDIPNEQAASRLVSGVVGALASFTLLIKITTSSDS